MNRQSKSAIKSLVLTLRHKLEEDIAIGLKRYGFAGERWLPLERLPHIERDDAATADHFRLRAALEQHLRRIGAEPASATAAQRGEAVEWFVREVAFTHLNRLVALKCLEGRGLIPEIITVRDAYGGRARAHYEYRFDHPAEAAAPDDALPAAIRHVCRIVYPEFRLLFDVGDPGTGRKPPADDIVWPSYPVLRECIALINGLDEVANSKSQMADSGRQNEASEADHASRFTDHVSRSTSLWLEDEIIGWIYQFYNAEQKEAIRARGAPKRPAEVAVINQFFTPRWIVKFLVDNTLGRLWLEMHPDSPRVRAKCDYLVPEPLAGGDTETRGHGDTEMGRHGDGERRFALDPDSPINNPKAPPRRKAKRPQDIRLIDPACGAMHFGHYAFEVYYEIYLDYYELYAEPISESHREAARSANGESANGESAMPESAGHAVANRQSEIPADILRYNLFGVDIDLRAVQLAALSLFIKAKTAEPNAHITQMNLVVADAVLPADGVRTQFLDRYKDDKTVQDAVRQVLDEMANVAEVGSLLRVEERLRAILEKAGHAAAKESPRTLEGRKQPPLPGMAGKGGQMALVDLPEAQPEDWGAHFTVARLLDDLREFAARALQTHDLNAQLFAEEAEKSVHLLDVFLNDYDAVVMNPPYGSTTEIAKRYLRRAYPNTQNDLYGAFIERAFKLSPQGMIGALTSRTFMFQSSFDKLRTEVLAKVGMPCLIELGLGILDDATVRTAASVFSNGKEENVLAEAAFFRLVNSDSRQDEFETALLQLAHGHHSPSAFLQNVQDFHALPDSRIAYWPSKALIAHFATQSALEPGFAKVCEGLTTGGDDEMLRHYWEVSRIDIESKWRVFSKFGGSGSYYFDFDLLIHWTPGKKATLAQRGNKLANSKFYSRSGLSLPRTCELGMAVTLLPEGTVFSGVTRYIMPDTDADTFDLLTVLNSRLCEAFMRMLTPDRDRISGTLRQLPIKLSADRSGGHLAESAYWMKSAWDTGNETCTRFDAPWLVQARRGTLLSGTTEGGWTADGQPLTAELVLPDFPASIFQLPAALDHLLAVEHAADARLQKLQAEIDAAVYDLYEITSEDRALIERELGNRPPEFVWPQMAGKADDEKRREHVRRLVSYFLLNALKEKRDGILPVTPVAGELSSLDAVRRGLEAEFGDAAAFRMESDIGQVLGQPLADWLDGPFIKWHTPLYKRRPIIWHLASPQNAFGCFVYLHKLDADTLRKVQTLYLWPRRRGVESERDEAVRAKTAGITGAAHRLEAAEALLDDLAEFEKRLLSVIQAQVKCEIPEWAEGPFRNGVYDPVLDDGVKVNITPLQEAGVLRYGKVV